MRVRLVRPQELNHHELDRWRDFRAGNVLLCSPYFTPEFTFAVAAERSSVWVAVIERNDSTIGFWPLERVGARACQPVGGPLSDYHGIVAQSGAIVDPIEVLKAAGLSRWRFDHLVHTDEVWAAHIDETSTSPYVDLEHGFEQYARERRAAGTSVVTKTQRIERKLEREHSDARFEFQSKDPTLLEWLIRYKQAQYRRTSAVDVFSFSWTGALLQRLHEGPSEGLQGILSGLYVGDAPIAAHYCLHSCGVMHSWFTTYDPAWAATRPGNVLLLKILRDCPPHSIKRFDFGKGPESYKYQFANGFATLFDGCVDSNRLRRLARHSLRQGKMLLKNSSLGRVVRIPGRLIYRIRARNRFG